MDLNEVLNETEEKPEVTINVEKAEAEAPPTDAVDRDYSSERKKLQRKEWEAQGRDPETGQFIKKEEPKEEVKTEVKVEPKVEQPKVDLSDKEKALLAEAERHRRRNKELETELAQYRQKKEEKTEEKKSFWDDPDGNIKATEERVDQKLSQKELNIILRTSEMIARSKYKDFDEKVETFAEVLKSTPGLHAQWLASQDPAEFAYRTGEKTRLLKDAGSIDEYKAKLEVELRQKLEAEYKAKEEEFNKKRAELPGSLSEVKGVAKQQRAVFTGPTPLDAVLFGKD